MELKALGSKMGLEGAFEYSRGNGIADYVSSSFDKTINKGISLGKVGAGYSIAAGSVALTGATEGLAAPVGYAGFVYGSKVASDGVVEFGKPYVSREGGNVKLTSVRKVVAAARVIIYSNYKNLKRESIL